MGGQRSLRFCRWVGPALIAGVVTCGTVCAQADPPKLIPLPREFSSNGAAVALTKGVLVSAPGGDSEDRFAADLLRGRLAERAITRVAGAYTVRLLRQDSTAGRAVLAANHLSFEPAMHDEGYALVTGPRGADVVAATAAGVFYGSQSLLQMISGRGKTAQILRGAIRDWPAMRYRGIDDDLSRGPFPTLGFQKHQIEVFASYKINVYSPYFEHTLEYEANPLAAPPGSAMSREDVAELVRFARQYHVTIVPEQEAFGHLHHVLTYEYYSPLAETAHGHVLSPMQPGSLELIRSWFREIAGEFPGPFIHIGADETFELGQGQTKEQVAKHGLGPVYAGFLTQIDAALKPLGRKLLFWGDVAMNDPAAVANLPKDMIAVPWVYSPEPSYDKFIEPFVKQNMETWVAPGDSNWNVVYPIADNAFRNIQGFVRDGQRFHSTGALTTVWNDDGEGLFNEDWYGVLFGAAAAWQPGESDIAAYRAAFPVVFFGDSTGTIAGAQKEMMAAQALIGGDDRMFWIDPWSAEGRLMAERVRPRLHDMRLHAENVVMLVRRARREQPGLRERAALDALDLGARRLDFLGMKFQLADEMVQAYNAAYALPDDGQHTTEKRELLYSISSMNGRCEDLRDGFSQLKELYRAAWLEENRPYWLDNVLVRYDLQIELWQHRANEFTNVIGEWQRHAGLPPPEQLGLPPAAAGTQQR